MTDLKREWPAIGVMSKTPKPKASPKQGKATPEKTPDGKTVMPPAVASMLAEREIAKVDAEAKTFDKATEAALSEALPKLASEIGFQHERVMADYRDMLAKILRGESLNWAAFDDLRCRLGKTPDRCEADLRLMAARMRAEQAKEWRKRLVEAGKAAEARVAELKAEMKASIPPTPIPPVLGRDGIVQKGNGVSQYEYDLKRQAAMEAIGPQLEDLHRFIRACNKAILQLDGGNPDPKELREHLNISKG